MTFKLTSDFKVEIPTELREKLGLKEGDEVTWVGHGRSASLLRVPTVEEMMGTLKGMDVSGYRDEEDRS
ncbi:MAG: AbrB/MazE/SpoVT family DNA-binding domain-containing protein [Bryobacteraceae bacterium]